MEESLAILGYQKLTPIQEQVIPLIAKGNNVVVKARTGSGKTAAYAIPLCENIDWENRQIQVLILACTRELVKQIAEEVELLGKSRKIKVVSLIGKENIEYQKEELRQRCHVVVATPGRLLDLMQQNNISLGSLHFVVVDEADYMMSLGFYEQLHQIFAQWKEKKLQYAFFSATYPEPIKKIIDEFLMEHVTVAIEELASIRHQYCQVDNKWQALLTYLSQQDIISAIIFVDTQKMCEMMYQRFHQIGMHVVRLHGGLQQKTREKNLRDFQEGKSRILVATDIAARGLDIDKVSHVIHYCMPNTIDDYIHRCGRSARKEEKGVSLLFSENQSFLEELAKKYDLQRWDGISQEIRTLEETINYYNMPLERHQKKQIAQPFSTLHLNIGKTKKVRAGDIVGACLAIEGITIDDIGTIKVLHAFTYVDVRKEKSDLVIKQLKKIKGKTVKVEKSR